MKWVRNKSNTLELYESVFPTDRVRYIIENSIIPQLSKPSIWTSGLVTIDSTAEWRLTQKSHYIFNKNPFQNSACNHGRAKRMYKEI